MRTQKTTERHEAFRQAVLKAMMPFDDIPKIEQLAVLSATLGQMVALQDSRIYTADAVMRLVASNIEMGNASAITGVAMGVIKP